MRRRTAVILLLALAVAGYVVALPPEPLVVTIDARPLGPRGAIHIHTNRSDGAGTPEDVAGAAARAGLEFVVLTDHGDGTRPPDPPRYVDGVLVIDAIEVSTEAGHVLAVGLLKAAPYPMGGEPRDVVDDIHRLGGTALAAHPWSPRRELRWTDRAAAIDGLEWLNGDSEWRDESAPSLLRALLTYPVRRAGAIASVLDRPDRVIGMWDELLKSGRAVAVAAVDAHARVGVSEPYDTRIALRLPSYESMFRTMTIRLDSHRFVGDADRDAAAVFSALRSGALHSVVDALASPGAVSVSAISGTRSAAAGENLPLSGPVTIRVAATAPPGAVIALIKDGDGFQSSAGPVLEESVPAEPAVYRVEVRLPGAPGQPPVPWIVSNPIYVGRADGSGASASAPRAGAVFTSVYADEATTTAGLEHSPESQAALNVIAAVPGHQLLFRYAIGGRRSESPFAAVAFPLKGAGQHDRISFRARADRPMRLNVQLRAPGAEGGRRWYRSVFIDETARVVEVLFAEMRPLPGALDNKVPVESIESLIFAVDAVHTRPGTAGQIWLDDVKLGRE